MMTAPAISIVVPTLNERDNIRPLAASIAAVMGNTAWELIVVDDDSPDGTAEEAIAIAHEGLPIRCIRRVGRRGLASAVIEGALSSNADVIAVMDADMQHDESLLPKMLDILRTTDTDIVIGSRYSENGGTGDLSSTRRRMSQFANWCSTFVLGARVADPMSGLFAIRRDLLHACIYDLSQRGYKILLDILTSSPHPLRVVELPYVFRSRVRGESKLDLMVLLDFAFLLIDKLTHGALPPKFVLFCTVGGIGLIFHLFVLYIFHGLGTSFVVAQIAATYSAMTLNYITNNAITYRSERRTGVRFWSGYALFVAICSVGSIANIGVAELVLSGSGGHWSLSGFAGALMGAIFNFSVATRLVWRQRRNPRPTPLRFKRIIQIRGVPGEGAELMQIDNVQPRDI